MIEIRKDADGNTVALHSEGGVAREADVIASSRDSGSVINRSLANSNVFLRNGTYKINVTNNTVRPIGIAFSRSNASLTGESREGVLLDAANPLMTMISTKDYHLCSLISNIQIKNLRIKMNKNDLARIDPHCGIALRKINVGPIDNVEIHSGQYIGIAVTGVDRFPEDGGGGNITISNCSVFDCNDNGFDIAGGGMRILNCYASNNNGHGQNHEANIDMDGAKNAYIDGFTSIGARRGIHNGNPARPSCGTVIRNVRVYSPRDAGVELDGTTNCYIEDTYVEGNPSLYAWHGARATLGANVNLVSPPVITLDSLIRTK
ncbi:MAG: right-handed parallel beta-helix repeat-containing protein [Thermoproteota archaeon]|nr:right-handed parallel beta-helix repeat-containing protein [Thermoproteota archaeon]